MKTHTSLPIVLLLAAAVAAVPIGWAAPVQAQGAPQGAPQPGQMAGAQQVEGKVAALDPSGNKLTLEDGTELTVPAGAQLPPDVKEGSIIRASFEEHAGQKMLIGLDVQKPWPFLAGPTVAPIRRLPSTEIRARTGCAQRDGPEGLLRAVIFRCGRASHRARARQGGRDEHR